MTIALKLVALFSLVGVTGAAAVETAGYAVPSAFGLEAGISVFVTALALLTLAVDYRKRRSGFSDLSFGAVMLPAAEAFAGSRSPVSPRRSARPRTSRATVKL
ncbi:MAG TPA: hypothetical protein VHF69_02345 [Candidatus Synoicihabitans sp.]|nr:hypothetical protein [Candidatus Synoicihabitans sp.]